jgi:hypothetical protein
MVTCGGQLPATYYDEVDNPDYDPNDPESTPTILVNNFLEMTEGDCPYDKGSVQDNGDGTGTWVDTTDYLAVQMEEANKETFALIQARVDKFNKLNNTTFNSVYTCKAYKDEPNYSYNQFCSDVFSWNTQVWEKAGQIRRDVLAGTMTPPATIEEYLALLPEYTGTMTIG